MPLQTDGEINEFIRENAKKLADQREFCLNSRRWIAFMILNKPPESCPHSTESFSACGSDHCSYYQMRLPTKYFKSKMKTLTDRTYPKE